MKPHYYDIVFRNIGKAQKFEFDDFSNRLRRGLMLSCSALIVLCSLEPAQNTNSYEVNIGIIKGTLSQPWLVYLMVIAATIYYLSFFIIHLRKLVVDNCIQNFSESLFYFHLGEVVANNKIRSFWQDENGTYHNPPTITFRNAGGGAESIFPVKSIQDKLKLPNEQFSKIEQHNEFRINKSGDGYCTITYLFEPNKEDYIAYQKNKDKFLRYRVSDWFTAIFPIYYGIFSIICGFIKLGLIINIIKIS